MNISTLISLCLFEKYIYIYTGPAPRPPLSRPYEAHMLIVFYDFIRSSSIEYRRVRVEAPHCVSYSSIAT